MPEAQEQHFRQSLWNGEWLVVPVPPPLTTVMPAPMAGSPESGVPAAAGAVVLEAPVPRAAPEAEDFRQAMWNGEWRMVPMSYSQPPPLPAHYVAAAEGVADPPSGVPDTERARYLPFRLRVQRCMRVYRWQRMQRVWTEWMRASGSQAGSSSLA